MESPKKGFNSAKTQPFSVPVLEMIKVLFVDCFGGGIILVHS
jgi:hypothetical protein